SGGVRVLARLGQADGEAGHSADASLHRRGHGARVMHVVGEVGPAVDPGGDQVRRPPFAHVVEPDVDRVGRRAVHRPALDLSVRTPGWELLDAQRTVQRDAAAGGALLAVRRADHHVAKLEQRLRERPQPLRFRAVVVGDEDPHGAQCGAARIRPQRALAGPPRQPHTARMSEARTLAFPLPPAPERLAADDGTPRYGLFAGSVADARFGTLKHVPGILERRLIEKRWQYVFLATPEMMLALAIIDCGYLSSGICAVFDRGSGRLLVDDNPVLPPICAQVAEQPSGGMSARLLGPRIRARMQRAGSR